MSGGHFEYENYRLSDIGDKLRLSITKCRKGYEYYEYKEPFLNEMIRVYNLTRELEVLLERVDWVLSGDDGEDTYFERLQEDIADIEYDNPAEDDKWSRYFSDD